MMTGAGIVGAAVSAGLVAYVIGLAPAQTAAPQPQLRPERSRPSPTLGLQNFHGRLSRLEQAIETQKGAPDAQAADEGSVNTPAPVRPSFEESRQRSLKLAREHTHRFTAEAVDVEWAREASDALQADLGQIQSTAKWTSASVECRTSLCRGTMQWPSYQEAGASLMTILGAHYSRNCAITVTLPTPDDPAAPYEGNAFFDCTEDRAN
jgi:hypothetical protein